MSDENQDDERPGAGEAPSAELLEKAKALPTVRSLEARVDDVEAKARTVVAVINTDEVDRYNTVIDPKGGDFADYTRNPVLLWCHYTDAPPLGRALWVAKRDNKSKIKAKLTFDDDEFSDLVFRKYQSESLRAFSIRFEPEWRFASGPTPEELKARPDWEEAWVIYRKWKLMEISAVALPGNASALAEDVARGIRVPDDVRAAVEELRRATPPSPSPSPPPPTPSEPPALPRLTGRSFAEIHADLVRQIRGANPLEVTRSITRDTLDRIRGRI